MGREEWAQQLENLLLHCMLTTGHKQENAIKVRPLKRRPRITLRKTLRRVNQQVLGQLAKEALRKCQAEGGSTSDGTLLKSDLLGALHSPEEVRV